MDIGSDIKPVIADEVEYPGNDQRLPHKTVSFKESDLAAADGENGVK
jgi:hypothetical protein